LSEVLSIIMSLWPNSEQGSGTFDGMMLLSRREEKLECLLQSARF
jgi:hypothetical protein